MVDAINPSGILGGRRANGFTFGAKAAGKKKKKSHPVLCCGICNRELRARDDGTAPMHRDEFGVCEGSREPLVVRQSYKVLDTAGLD